MELDFELSSFVEGYRPQGILAGVWELPEELNFTNSQELLYCMCF